MQDERTVIDYATPAPEAREAPPPPRAWGLAVRLLYAVLLAAMGVVFACVGGGLLYYAARAREVATATLGAVFLCPAVVCLIGATVVARSALDALRSKRSHGARAARPSR